MYLRKLQFYFFFLWERQKRPIFFPRITQAQHDLIQGALRKREKQGDLCGYIQVNKPGHLRIIHKAIIQAFKHPCLKVKSCVLKII